MISNPKTLIQIMDLLENADKTELVRLKRLLNDPEKSEILLQLLNNDVLLGSETSIESQPSFIDESLETQVSNFLIRVLKIHVENKGYKYILSAIMRCLNDPSEYENITSGLYPKIAQEFDSTATGVERAIRHSIKTSWPTASKSEQVLDMFPVNSVHSKPSNSVYLVGITIYLKENYLTKNQNNKERTIR